MKHIENKTKDAPFKKITMSGYSLIAGGVFTILTSFGLGYIFNDALDLRRELKEAKKMIPLINESARNFSEIKENLEKIDQQSTKNKQAIDYLNKYFNL